MRAVHEHIQTGPHLRSRMPTGRSEAGSIRPLRGARAHGRAGGLGSGRRIVHSSRRIGYGRNPVCSRSSSSTRSTTWSSTSSRVSTPIRPEGRESRVRTDRSDSDGPVHADHPPDAATTGGFHAGHHRAVAEVRALAINVVIEESGDGRAGGPIVSEGRRGWQITSISRSLQQRTTLRFTSTSRTRMARIPTRSGRQTRPLRSRDGFRGWNCLQTPAL